MAERGQCRWCGNPIRWYETAAGGRVPLMPQQFPAHAIPTRYRWTIDAGLARHGTHPNDPERCHLNHALVCPCRPDRAELTDFTTQLERIRTALGVAHHKLLDRGFQPAPPPTPTPSHDKTTPPNTAERHVLAAGDSWLRLLPSRVENLQCVAHDHTTGNRCLTPVYEREEGIWRQLPITPHGSRTAQAVLELHNGLMWVWSLTTLTSHSLMRWYQQRCPGHGTPDHPAALEPELVPFNVVRHSDYILSQHPTGYDTTTPKAPTWTDARQTCATTGCPHGNAGPHTPGWKCWQCHNTTPPTPPAHSRWRALVAEHQRTQQQPHGTNHQEPPHR